MIKLTNILKEIEIKPFNISFRKDIDPLLDKIQEDNIDGIKKWKQLENFLIEMGMTGEMSIVGFIKTLSQQNLIKLYIKLLNIIKSN